MNTPHRWLLSRFAAGAATLAVLGACGGVSQVSEDAVSRADARLQQAQQVLGNNEAGAVELQRASDHLQQAKAAVKDGKDTPAQRHAQQAELDADLAVAKAQNATERKSVAELQASIQQLQQEAQRTPGVTR